MWIDSLFKALGEFFGFAKQERDPEVIRLNRIREIDNQLKKYRKEFDVLTTQDNPDRNAISILVDRIVELRREKDDLKR